jgi:hypothetical protein
MLNKVAPAGFPFRNTRTIRLAIAGNHAWLQNSPTSDVNVAKVPTFFIEIVDRFPSVGSLVVAFTLENMGWVNRVQ